MTVLVQTGFGVEETSYYHDLRWCPFGESHFFTGLTFLSCPEVGGGFFSLSPFFPFIRCETSAGEDEFFSV